MLISTPSGVFQLVWPPALGRPVRTATIFPHTRWNRHTRRTIEAAPFAYLMVEADPPPSVPTGPGPVDFHDVTIKWAARAASLNVVWSGDLPDDQDGFRAEFERHAHAGAIVTYSWCGSSNTTRGWITC